MFALVIEKAKLKMNKTMKSLSFHKLYLFGLTGNVRLRVCVPEIRAQCPISEEVELAN